MKKISAVALFFCLIFNQMSIADAQLVKKKDVWKESGSAIYPNSSNNIGIGDSTPASLFTVGASDKFQVDSNGNLVKIDNVTYDWPDSNSSGVLTNNGSGTLTWGAAASGDVTAVGDCADGTCLDGSSDGGTYIRLYDGDSHYGQVAVADITSANKTWTFPNENGTVCTTGSVCSGYQASGSYLTAEVDGSTTNEIEVVDEAYSAGNFNGGTTSAVSQDDFYDYQHIADTDDDGKIEIIDTATDGFVKTTGGNGTLSIDTSTYLTAEVDGSTTNELQNIFQTIATTSGTNPVADSTTDTLTLTAGSGITITGDSSTDTITFTATGGSGDITSVGDVTSGAAFDGTQGTSLTFNHASGDVTLALTATDEISFNTAGTEDLHVGIGTTDPQASLDIRVDSEDGTAAVDLRTSNEGSSLRGYVLGGSLASPSVAPDGENILFLEGYGYDGTNYERAGMIRIGLDINSVVGNNDVPGMIDFWTAPDGSNNDGLVGSVNQDGNWLIGSNYTDLGHFAIDGDEDEIQLVVQGNATQTTNLIVAENSAGTDQFTVSNTGNVAVTGDLTITGDDLFMATNTDRFVLMGDGTNYNPEAINLGTDTTGNYAAGDGEAGSATSLAADAVDALTEIAQSIKSAADDTSKLVVGTAGSTDDCAKWDSTGALVSAGAACGTASGAPTDADYLVGTANGGLSAEIVVGTSPGGELGGTWASPTLDDSVTTTGWVMGTFSATQLTSPTVIVDLLDANGAVDMDYGSADVTDHTFTTDGTGDAEIVLPADSIGPAEIDSTTGAYDFGGVTSFEIPNGTGPTVDAAGETAVDTTDDQLVYYGGAKRVLAYTQEKCFTTFAPVAGDDNVPFFSPKAAITVTGVYCRTQGGTSAGITISDGTNAFEEVTCDSDGQADDGSITNAGFTANERMEYDTGTVTGSVDFVNVCIRYTHDAQ